MRKLVLWVLWLSAIAVLLSAVQARTQHNATAQKDTCTRALYWESPLLK